MVEVAGPAVVVKAGPLVLASLVVVVAVVEAGPPPVPAVEVGALAVVLEVDPPGMGGEVRSPGAGVEGLPAAAVEVGPLDVVAETGLPAVCVTVLPTVVPAATRAA